jgi:histidinol-phosphate aminotransferase
VSAPALAAVAACCTPAATAEAAAWATSMDAERTWLGQSLSRVPGVAVTPHACASFLLLKVTPGSRVPVPGNSSPESYNVPIDHGGPTVRERLRAAGFAVRRGDTFPGLGPDWIRVAVRDRGTNDRFVAALTAVLEAL